MALTKWERKAKLRYGAVTSIARRCRRSKGHVSSVISGPRRDAVVEREVARRMKLPVVAVFGPAPKARKSRTPKSRAA